MKAMLGTYVAAALLAATVSAAPALGEDFFAGKTITLSTHSERGGGYEAYLRLLADHMGRHVPGRPSFAILNQPGGGGLRAGEIAGRNLCLDLDAGVIRDQVFGDRHALADGDALPHQRGFTWRSTR